MATDLWIIYPTGNAVAGANAAAAWHDAGLKVACMVDSDSEWIDCDLLKVADQFPGYVPAQNLLAREAFDAGAEAVLIGADDIYPGRNANADAILQHYREALPALDGAMQCTGDWYDAMAWCAPFPVIGKAWHQTRGAYHPGYRHYFADQDLKEHAQLLGKFVECPDIAIEHRHFTRGHADNLPSEKRNRAQQFHATDYAEYVARASRKFL